MNILSRIRFSFVLCAAAIAPLFASTSDDNTAYCQDSAASKLSSSLRRWLPRHNDRAASAPQNDLRTCAFIEKTAGADSVLLHNDCTILADFGDIVIADVLSHGSAASLRTAASSALRRNRATCSLSTRWLCIPTLCQYTRAQDCRKPIRARTWWWV